MPLSSRRETRPLKQLGFQMLHTERQTNAPHSAYDLYELYNIGWNARCNMIRLREVTMAILQRHHLACS
jgi:hypothetical protein